MNDEITKTEAPVASPAPDFSRLFTQIVESMDKLNTSVSERIETFEKSFAEKMKPAEPEAKAEAKAEADTEVDEVVSDQDFSSVDAAPVKKLTPMDLPRYMPMHDFEQKVASNMHAALDAVFAKQAKQKNKT